MELYIWTKPEQGFGVRLKFDPNWFAEISPMAVNTGHKIGPFVGKGKEEGKQQFRK